MRDNRRNVEDQDDRSIAEDGSAAHNRRRDQLIFERLDDKFFFAHEAIDRQAELAAASADHDHENTRGAFAHGVRTKPVQPNERENLLAQLKHLVVVDAVNALLGDPRDFRDGSKRHGVKASVDAEQERPNAREREWHEKPERRALSGRAMELNRALQGFERRFDYVETDTASGNLGDFVRGAEARSENQLETLPSR